MNIAVLVPVCSRNQNYSSFEDIPFLKYLYPSFQKTKEDGYTYTFFIGYDDDDIFYIENINILKEFKTFKLSGCRHAPATAWNKLAQIAFNGDIKYDYFFQIGDDVILETPGWTSHFVNKLKEHNNVGVVGPCNLLNYNSRKNLNRPFVIENSFVSRKHIETFNYFFHPSIKNWYCDDWITRVYDGIFCDIQVDYTCSNIIVDTRYAIDNCNDINKFIEEGKQILNNNRRVFSYCVFGNQKKYCLGMVKNLEQIRNLFPGYKVVIYLGNDVPQEYIDQYKTFHNVTLVNHNFTGGRLTAYRYFVLNELFDVVFVRDADSRFGHRDIWCITHFLNSEFKIFTIRDHKYHGKELMAGLTGFKNFSIPLIKSNYDTFISNRKDIDYYQNDQDFIEQYIFQQYKHETIAYSAFFNFGEKLTLQIPLPIKSNEDFCGNVYLFDDKDNQHCIWGNE
jgi:hypothetical protein